MVSAIGDRLRAKAAALVRRGRSDESGATAIEFAIVATPFILLLFGIMWVSMFYFANFTLENAAWAAARAIRTGQVQQSLGSFAGATTLQDRKQAFKAALCAKAPTFFDCSAKAVVIVQSNANFGGIVEPKCANNGIMIDQSAAGFDTGGSSAVVLVTVCYPWDLASKLPFFTFGNLNDGSYLMQASVAFRTEPY
jgi:Flp pilus assembly protein TadG